ncbi:MAG TPA: ATP-binding cassette domain-containing protein [Candidatus Mediterraneibacter cottocaccae]|nr:ATP-binding cassette domain-containing protein [Candidatus Mediterraneibacter cottocaccae]
MERNITDRKILEIRNLTKGFGSRGGYETRVIKGISMDIFPGDFIAVMGPSGAGKTTLLNLLSTLDKPDGGQILLDGENLEKVGNKRLSEIRRDKIGFIFQEYNLLDNMSLEDNIALPLSLNGVKSTEVRRRVQKMAAVFGLTEHLKKYPYQLSGGQKQRGAGARALVTEPEILFADEPTGNVTLVQHYPKEIPVIFFSLSTLISLIADRQRVRFSSRVSEL